jgi:hypothetical protein
MRYKNEVKCTCTRNWDLDLEYSAVTDTGDGGWP